MSFLHLHSRLILCLMASLIVSSMSACAAARTGSNNPLLQNHTFVVFDVETTGLSPRYERIVELGAVKIENGIIVDEKSWLINPKKRISHGAQNVHGIDYDMIKKQQTFKTQYPEIRDFMGDSILLAHNARFDRDFLYNEVSNSGFDIPENKIIDTLRLFRAWYPDAPSHSLGSLVEQFQISGGSFHRGLDDSVYTAKIFLQGMESKKAPRKLSDLNDVGGIASHGDKK